MLKPAIKRTVYSMEVGWRDRGQPVSEDTQMLYRVVNRNTGKRVAIFAGEWGDVPVREPARAEAETLAEELNAYANRHPKNYTGKW